jgi:hypothetical protein
MPARSATCYIRVANVVHPDSRKSGSFNVGWTTKCSLPAMRDSWRYSSAGDLGGRFDPTRTEDGLGT